MTVEYRDEAPFTGDNHTPTELANAIRTKKNGKDVREPIAQLADKLDSAIKGQSIGNVVATPTKVFANLSELQSAYPNGADGVMVTVDNGHKYFWQNSSWVDGGVYQASSNPNLDSIGTQFSQSFTPEPNMAHSSRLDPILVNIKKGQEFYVKTTSGLLTFYSADDDNLYETSELPSEIPGNQKYKIVAPFDISKIGIYVPASQNPVKITFDVYLSNDNDYVAEMGKATLNKENGIKISSLDKQINVSNFDSCWIKLYSDTNVSDLSDVQLIGYADSSTNSKILKFFDTLNSWEKVDVTGIDWIGLYVPAEIPQNIFYLTAKHLNPDGDFWTKEHKSISFDVATDVVHSSRKDQVALFMKKGDKIYLRASADSQVIFYNEGNIQSDSDETFTIKKDEWTSYEMREDCFFVGLYTDGTLPAQTINFEVIHPKNQQNFFDVEKAKTKFKKIYNHAHSSTTNQLDFSVKKGESVWVKSTVDAQIIGYIANYSNGFDSKTLKAGKWECVTFPVETIKLGLYLSPAVSEQEVEFEATRSLEDVDLTANNVLEAFKNIYNRSTKFEKFIYFTDPHNLDFNNEFGDGHRKSFEYLFEVLRQYAQKISPTLIVSGGDWLNTGDTPQSAFSKINEVRGTWKNKLSAYPFINAVGNHDYDWENFSLSETKFTHDEMDGLWNDKHKTFFSYDTLQTKWIVLDTGDANGSDEINDFERTQLSWLENLLKENKKEHVMIIQHIFSRDYSAENSEDSSNFLTSETAFAKEVVKLVDAFNGRTTIEDYDFSSSEIGTVHAILCGHNHYNACVTVGDNLPVIESEDATNYAQVNARFELCFADYENKKMYMLRVNDGDVSASSSEGTIRTINLR